MVTIPIARESLVRIVNFLEAQKVTESRMACLDLAARRPAVIGQIVAAAQTDRGVDQSTEGILRRR